MSHFKIIPLDDPEGTRCLVLMNSPTGFALAQPYRDMMFSTGRVIDVKEIDLQSIQPEMFAGVSYRPLRIIAYRASDRYGAAVAAGIVVSTTDDINEVLNLCEAKLTVPDFEADAALAEWIKSEAASSPPATSTPPESEPT